MIILPMRPNSISFIFNAMLDSSNLLGFRTIDADIVDNIFDTDGRIRKTCVHTATSVMPLLTTLLDIAVAGVALIR